MLAEIIFAGFGGQGVLLAGQTLAKCAMWHGLEVSWIPAYGPEMRGGTANCTVVLADSLIASPMATQYDYALMFNQPSLDKFLAKVKDGGLIIFDSSVVKPPTRKGVTTVGVPAATLADEVGSIKCANMVMLGALIKRTGLLPLEAVTDKVERLFTGKKSAMAEINLKALRRGAEVV